MANFSPGWNFSLVSRAEISARFLEQIPRKSNWRLHGEWPSPGRNSSRAENPIPVLKNRARIFSPGKRAKKPEKIPCNRHGISARDEKQEKRRLPLRSRSDFNGIKAIKWRISLISKLREMEYENIETRLNREAGKSVKHKSASLRMYFLPMQMRLTGWEICSQRQVSFLFAFHHHCRLLNTNLETRSLTAGRKGDLTFQLQTELDLGSRLFEYYSKNLKIECQQRVKLRESQLTNFDDSCLHAFWFSWDFLHTISYLASRLTFQPGLRFVT